MAEQRGRVVRLAGRMHANPDYDTRGRFGQRQGVGRRTTKILVLALAFLSVGVVAAMVLGRGEVLHLAGLPETAGQAVDGTQFAVCGSGGRVTCVVDGDTIWFEGTKIRIADIDTPEVSSPSCAQELALGKQATTRLAALLNAGPFDIESYARDEDKYGRKLRILSRDGHSLGATLVDEGLAHVWDGRRHSWCGAGA